MDDLLVCKCGWFGKWDEQDALGSECGCCPDCGNENLIWLSELQERIKKLEDTIQKIRLISGRSYKLPVTSVAAMKNLKIINQKAEQALKGGK